MVRAVGITGIGGPEVLQPIDRPVRAPRPEEIRIAVRAAAVNPADVGMRTCGGRDVPPPWIPSMEAAGVVEAVGDGVERLSVGQRVMAVVNPFRPEGGAQIEQLVVPEASVVPIPTGATLEQAATLPMNGLTARLGLEILQLPEGSTLAVTGGAGHLASYVITLAKESGLRVIADAKPEDADLVRSIGADDVVPRGSDFGAAVRAAAPEGADAVYDTAVLHEGAFGAVCDGGVILDVSGWQPPATERGITVKQEFVIHAFDRTDWLKDLSRLASSGRLQFRGARESRPEDAGEAHRLLEAGGLRSRPVIVF